MYNSFNIKSQIRGTYSVNFIEDLSTQLKCLVELKDIIFIIDEKVANLFTNEIKPIIESSRKILIASNEANKTINYSQDIIRELILLNVRKNDTLIAIGGGITQDIVTFISSILFRGVNWKFFPTTLLAQCDSCIGSKSSINFDNFKNLIGTFNPPSEIFIYPGFLKTLTESEIRSGIGEMLHYYFTDGIDLAQEVSDKFEILLKDRKVLPYFISNSLRIKKGIIELDEFDTSIRHIFNFGHTFGHAIEAITNYSIPHGQAISIGMDLANFIALSKGHLSNNDFEIMHSILRKNIPPFKFTPENIENYLEALSRDKKNKGNQLGCILLSEPGKASKVFIELDNHLKSLIINYSKQYIKK
jgi:3-dehydroquinate synthase